MDPSCPHSKRYKGKIRISGNNRVGGKGKSSSLNRPTSSRKPDDVEREDFEEEKRVPNHCPELIVDRKHKYGRGGKSNLETVSVNDRIGESSKPSSSKDTADGNSSTNKNVNKSKTYPIEEKKEDFMQKLLNSNIQEKKSFPKGKLYNAEAMAEVNQDSSELCDTDTGSGPSGRTSSNASSIGSAGSDKELSVSSTLNADKLLGLDYKSKRTETDRITISRAVNTGPHYFSEDYLDEAEETWCTCHEDEDEYESEPEPDRQYRKRRYEPVPPQHSAKKFCPDGSFDGCQDVWESATSTDVQSSSPPELKQWMRMFQMWNNTEKTQAIDALISRCNASQVRHMMKSIEPLFQRDFISLLPKELALSVLGYLEPQDLLLAAQTCRYWKFLADDNLLWKEQCRRIGITTFRCKMPRCLPRYHSPWKAAYMRQHMIEDNWLHKPVTNAMLLRGHDDHVITCLQFYGNRILSGSDDTTLKVWSVNTGRCLQTLVGHSGGVWSSQMVGDLVVSGSTDRTLRIWNANTGVCTRVLSGHTSTVRCMHLHGNRVVSGSRDATLRMWSVPGGDLLRVLVGHVAAVRCVQFDGKYVVSGAYDYYVKVWNPDTGECLHTLLGHTNRVYSLQFDGVHVVSGSLDTSIRVWDVETGQLRHTLTGHQSLTSGMELSSNILVSGNADSTVKVWDISTGRCLHTLSGPHKHQSAVTCLQSTNRFVVTSSDDGTVKLWDVRTGEFIRNLVHLSSGGSGGVVWRIRASSTKLICAVGSRNGTEETKLLVLDFDITGACRKCVE